MGQSTSSPSMITTEDDSSSSSGESEDTSSSSDSSLSSALSISSLSSSRSGGISPPFPLPIRRTSSRLSSASSSIRFDDSDSSDGGEDSDDSPVVSRAANIIFSSSGSEEEEEEEAPASLLRAFFPRLRQPTRVGRRRRRPSILISDSEMSSQEGNSVSSPNPVTTRAGGRTRRPPNRNMDQQQTSAAVIVPPAAAAVVATLSPTSAAVGRRGRGRPRGGAGSQGGRSRTAPTAAISTSPRVTTAATAPGSLIFTIPAPAATTSSARSTAAAASSSSSHPIPDSGKGFVKMDSPSSPPSRRNANLSFNPSYFECIVCLENLDSPATLIETAAPGPGDGGGVQPLIMLLNVNPLGGGVQQQPAPPAVAQAQRLSAANAKKEAALAKIDPREICSTACGHLYHKYCIQKWFNEQGRKTCPSCRKPCGKLIRLFPNVGQDAPSQRDNYPNNQGRSLSLNLSGCGAAAAGGSGDDGSGATGSGGGPVIGPLRHPVQTGCGNPRCADLVTIHETLVSDYNELRTAISNDRDQSQGLREDLQIRTAELASLQDLYDNLGRENADLRAAAAEANSGPVKRRRRNE